jgi:hypothetical protein
MTPFETFFSVMNESKFKGGCRVPFAYVGEEGELVVSYTSTTTGAFLCEDEGTRVRAIIASIKDTKNIVRERGRST